MKRNDHIGKGRRARQDAMNGSGSPIDPDSLSQSLRGHHPELRDEAADEYPSFIRDDVKNQRKRAESVGGANVEVEDVEDDDVGNLSEIRDEDDMVRNRKNAK